MNLTIGLKWVREDIANALESVGKNFHDSFADGQYAAYEDALQIIDTHQKRLAELNEVINRGA